MKKLLNSKKNYFILFVALMLLTSFNNKSFAQNKSKTIDPADGIEVSETLFKKIQSWQALGENQTIPLDQYLSQSGNVEKGMEPKISKLISELRGNTNSAARGTECNCTVLTVNSTYDVAPSYSDLSHPGADTQPGLTTWYKEQIYGTATRQHLKLNSPTKNNEYEYEKSITGDEVSSNSYSRLSFNYICTNGSLLPEDCGCSKNMYLRASYYNKSSVSTSATGGWGTHSCFAAVEDDVVLFSIDQYGTDTDVTVLKGGQYQLSRAQDDTWNPEFWMNIVDLASAVAGVVEDFDAGIDWSDTIADVGGQIVTVFDTPVDIHFQEEEDGEEPGNYTMSYDGGVTLHPNHILSVIMISKGYIYGKGKGKFVSESWHKSDYFISAVLPLDNSTPECCMENYGKWVSGSMGAQGYTGLKNSIASHVGLWTPWDNLSDPDGDGNVNITNHIGYAYRSGDCESCGQDPITGLGISASGINIGSGTRPVHFSWDGQALVDNYIIKIYNSDGVLIHTLNTNDTTIIVSLVPGDYSFTVQGLCENGESSVSSSYGFIVNSLYADADTNNPFEVVLHPNPAHDDFTIALNRRDFRSFTVQITNSQGQTFHEASLNTNTHTVNISRWPLGLYFCKVTVDNQVQIKKLIKQ
ncbi:T9SS type A sorting domain-containing protein [uncultured Lacinutrix sp.]|uniref:T9SS type A sorting domain-containing protein n=1 Tax=uncultured Lacinutrix sp. TaxID=574032 RepID=UPI00261665CD|nr:T9SS type A sorting domain-containing protein [uncultured Lacinutrix sp.]